MAKNWARTGSEALPSRAEHAPRVSFMGRLTSLGTSQCAAYHSEANRKSINDPTTHCAVPLYRREQYAPKMHFIYVHERHDGSMRVFRLPVRKLTA